MKVKLSKDKLYYTISDVSTMLNLKASVIRFWETKFLVLRSNKREKNSTRKYKLKDIQYLYKIKELLYFEKYTIKGAIEQLKSWKANYSFEELCALIENKDLAIFENDQESLITTDLIVKERKEAFSAGKPKIITADTKSEILLTRARMKIMEITKLLNRLK